MASLALVVFIGFSFVGDYSDFQRKDDFLIGQDKAKVLFALQDNDCDLANEHYQTYRDAKGSEHDALFAAIQSCVSGKL